MASIIGTSGNDVLTGTTSDDVIEGGDGNDRINGGAGNDIIYGGAGADTLTGDAGNDTLYGGDGNDGFFGGGGNDTLYGEAGDDVMFGDGGDDVLFGGDGNDTLNGGTGNDTLVGGAGNNIYNGGSGIDTIVIDLPAGVVSAAVKADIATLKGWMDGQLAAAGSTAALSSQTAGPSLTLAALGVTISNIEAVTLRVGGVVTPIQQFLNSAPVADANVALVTNEDTSLSGQISATDIDGDTLGYALANGPQHGTLSLNAATGQFVYTPGENFNGSDSFEVAIADPSGAAVIQKVTVGVNAVNDAPIADAAVSHATEEDKSVSGVVAASDADGEALAWSLANGPAHGALVLNATTGAYTYTPAEGFAGQDTFDVAVTDAQGASVIQRVTVNVSPVADQPTLAVVNPVVVPTGLIINGFNSADTLIGTAGADVISGNSGNDFIRGGGPTPVTVSLDISARLTDLDGSETLSIRIDDVPEGGVLSAGINNGDGSWTLTGAQLAGLKLTASITNSFTLQVTATATESDGSQAHAIADINVVMTADANTIYGGAGNDTIVGGSGNDTIYGNSGNDTIFGNGGDDRIFGGKGDDIISGGAGNNLLRGDSDNDTFLADAGNDTIIGGSGFDTIDYSAATTSISVDVSKKTIIGIATGTDSITSTEKIIGTSFADTFKGSSGVDILVGGGGNDVMRGIAGNDVLTGGSGADRFFWEKTDVADAKGKSVGVDRITDFGSGDILDFTKLVSPGTKPIGDFVKITAVSGGSLISANINGSFEDVAILDGVSGKTIAQLMADGQLLIG